MNKSKLEYIEMMDDWFRRNYEDPAESTPYDTREGGYIYLNGGPYDAFDVLSNKFINIVPDDIIGEYAEELTKESFNWAKVSE